MEHTGSQVRERIEETDYKLICIRLDGKVALLNNNGACEWWALSDDYAGYVLEIKGQGYEFARTAKDNREG